MCGHGFPNFRNYYTNQWAPKKEGKEKYRGALLYKYFSWVGGGNCFIFVLFADVGPSVLCGEAIVRQTQTTGLRLKNKMFKYSVSELLPETCPMSRLHLLAHPRICGLHKW